MAVVNRRPKHEHRLERTPSPAYYLIKRLGRFTPVQIAPLRSVSTSTIIKCAHEPFREQCHALAKRLCGEHPLISVDKDIFGGVPHIKDVRLSVGDVLSKIYVYGNVQKVVDIYAPHVSEEHVKEAIAYAQDFLENACDPDDSSETDDRL